MENSYTIPLLLRIAHDKGPLDFMESLDIKREWFNKSEAKILDFMLGWIEQHEEVPSVRLITSEFTVDSDEIFPDSPRSLAALARKSYLDGLVYELTSKVQVMTGTAQVDMSAMRPELEQLLGIIDDNRTNNNVLPMHHLENMVLEDYNKRKLTATKFGIPYGIDYFDENRDGIQPEDFIAVVARPGVGKTQLLMFMAKTAFEAGYNVLWVGTEMQDLQYTQRFMTMRASVDMSSFKNFTLSSHIGIPMMEDNALRTEAGYPHISGNGKNNWLYVLKSRMSRSLNDVVSCIHSERPDIVFVDGAYLLHTNSTMSRFDRVSTIADYLKAAASTTPCSVVAAFQLQRNKKGDDVSDIYMSDSIGQLASVVISLVDEKIDDKGSDSDSKVEYKVLTIAKGRRGEKGKIRLEFDYRQSSIRQTAIIQGRQDSDE